MNSVLQTQTGFFPSMDSGLFLEIGLILLTVSFTVFFALWTAQIFDSTSLGVILATGFFTTLYLGVTALNLDLLMASPIAIALSAVAILVASLTANIKVSRAEL